MIHNGLFDPRMMFDRDCENEELEFEGLEDQELYERYREYDLNDAC